MLKIKPINAKVGYRIESIVFSQDGSLYANIQIGSIEEVENAVPNFHPIASQSHSLTPDEVNLLTIQTDEPISLKAAVEHIVETKLREKGSLKI